MESSNLLRAIALSWAIAVGNNPQLSGNPTKQQLSKLFSQDSSINKGKAQNPEFIVVSSSDLKGSPFDPSHPMISLNATNLLWASQSEKILSEFNAHDQKLTFEEKLGKGIKVPIIYPGLKKESKFHLFIQNWVNIFQKT